MFGKFIAVGGDVEYYDGSNLRERLIEEMGDVKAALLFVAGEMAAHPPIDKRAAAKLRQFQEWQEEHSR